MSNVLVTDFSFKNLEIEEEILRPLGCSLLARQCRTVDDLLAVVGEADYVLTQFAPIDRRVIGAMGRTRVIVRYGIGVDNVDLEAARARGIPVCNVPGFCADEVADHTLAMILSATRHLPANGRRVREGAWGLAVPLEAMRALRDLTVGLVGFGKIGREVAGRLRGFKCRVLACDPNVAAGEFERQGAEPVRFESLLSESDVVSLHCPSTPETRKLINRAAIAQMKAGAILINLARGDVVETEALIEALRSGQLSAAMLDVTDPEPPPADSPLRTLDNVLVTSHISSASARAVRTLRETAAGLVARVVRGEPPINVVNGVGA
jgi:D-3-phosphoglycerate dehydrogenase